MKTQFKRLIHRKLINKHRISPVRGEKLEDLYLPPSSCQHCLHDLSRSCLEDAPTKDSENSIFQNFPREIRLMILVHAFGNRTLHMDLSFDHPMAEWKPKDIPMTTHAGINSTEVIISCKTPPPVRRNTREPKSWQWWGSICHRKPPEHLIKHSGWRQSEPEAGEDFCRFGVLHHCGDWPGEYPAKCKIGAMGWLLACRQAYNEGIEVLYSTNTINMSGPPLLSSLLPQLLPPRHLANIKSLEIVVPLEMNDDAEGQMLSVKDDGIKAVLELLGQNMPTLRQLNLSLKSRHQLCYRGSFDAASFFAPLDAFMRHPKLDLASFAVSVSQSVYDELYMSKTQNVGKSDLGEMYDKVTVVVDQLWRTFDGGILPLLVDKGEEPVMHRTRSPYPWPPDGPVIPGAEVYGKGYWVVEGDDDYAFRSVGCERPMLL